MSKLGKIGFLISGLALAILFVARLILQGWVDFLFVPLAIAIATFVGAVVVDYRFYVDFLTMRTTKHGMNMGVLILLAFALVVAVNYLGVRFDKKMDVTKEQMNSLSEQSQNIVRNLRGDLNVLIFYKTKKMKSIAMEVKNDFNLYSELSKNVKVTIHNSDVDVELAKKYLQGSEGFAAVVEYQGRRVIIPPVTLDPSRPVYQESDITASIIKVLNEKARNIYFVTGHGEKDTETQALDGLKVFADALRADGYTVTKLNLLAGDKMPDAESVVAIVGPKTPMTDGELKQIREFALGGGRLFLAIDPGERHQMALLTKSLGVEFYNTYVMNDVLASDDGPAGAVGVEFDATSEVTKKFPRGSMVLFAYASPLGKAPDAPTENTYTPLVLSLPMAYVQNSPTAPTKNPEKKQFTLGMAVKGPKVTAIVFGDSDFLTDFRIGMSIHGDLALNSIAFLAGDSANLTIRPKRFEATQLHLTEGKKLFIYLSSVSLPLLLIICSGVFWYRRKNL